MARYPPTPTAITASSAAPATRGWGRDTRSPPRPGGRLPDDPLQGDAGALGGAQLALPPQGVEDGQHLQGEEGAGGQAADHRGGHPANDLRARPLGPQQGEQPGG